MEAKYALNSRVVHDADPSVKGTIVKVMSDYNEAAQARYYVYRVQWDDAEVSVNEENELNPAS